MSEYHDEVIEELARRMREGKILTTKRQRSNSLTGEHHRRVLIEGCPPLLGKPAFPVGLLRNQELADRAVRNEEAASLVGRALGINDLVPIAVVREMLWPKLKGLRLVSLQAILEEAKPKFPKLRDCSESDKVRAAVFDYLIKNTDRAPRNWMGEPGDPPKLHLIDNALSFDWPDRRLQSDFAETWDYKKLPSLVVDAIDRLLREPPERLREVLSAEAFDKLLQRASYIVENGYFNRNDMP